MWTRKPFLRRRPGQISSWWIAVLLALAIGILGVYIRVAVADSRTVSAVATSQAHSERGGLALIGWADRSRVASAGSFRLYLTVENHANVAMERIGLVHLDTPGLKPVGTCWDPFRRLPACGTHPGPAGPLPQRLGPGEAASLWTDLRATGASGARAATALFTASRADKPAEQQILGLSVGPIEEAAGGLLTWAKALLSFLKDLALPLMLAALAFAFQNVQQERSRVNETINLILPLAHENAGKHLLPVVGATDQLLARYALAVGAASSEQAIAKEESLFFLLSAVKGMRDLTSHGGGIFFSDLVGEDAILFCWRTLRHRVEKRLGSGELSAVLDSWSRKESLSSMRLKFSGADGELHPAFEQLKSNFEGWLGSQEFETFDQRLCRAFSYIMQREIDRLYWTWYGEEPALEPQAIEELLEALPCAPIDDTRRQALRKALSAYLEFNDRR
jgi:hypothetical protein